MNFRKYAMTPQSAALVAAIAAFVLATSKGLLFLASGSLVVALSAWDSAMDFVISSVNRKVLKFARLQPDDNHPYGHGKAESIASLGQGALLFGGALTVVGAAVESIVRIIVDKSEVPDSSWFAVLFFCAAAAISVCISSWLQFHGRVHRSPALKADAEHYRSDVLTNLGSGLGMLIVSLSELAWLDPVIAIGFAIVVARSGYSLMRSSVNELMDHDVPDDLKLKVEAYCKEIVPEIIDLHKFRGRQSGSRYLFDFHVTLPPQLSFEEVHERVEVLEERILDQFNADAVIHADPEGVDSPTAKMETPAALRLREPTSPSNG